MEIEGYSLGNQCEFRQLRRAMRSVALLSVAAVLMLGCAASPSSEEGTEAASIGQPLVDLPIEVRCEAILQRDPAYFPYFHVAPQIWEQAQTPAGATAAVRSVAIDGEVAAAALGGKVTVFTSSNLASLNGWAQGPSFQPELGLAGDYGASLAIRSKSPLVAVGAPGYAVDEPGYVAIYEQVSADAERPPFVRQHWRRTQILLPPRAKNAAATSSMHFGSSLAIEGDTLVVGAEHFFHSSIANTNKDQLGIVYVYKRNQGSAWQLAETLSPLSSAWLPYPGFGSQPQNPPLPGDGYEFGHTVAISNGTIAVGANDHDCQKPLLNWCGRVHLYQLSSTGLWAPTSIVTPHTPYVTGFGLKVALDGSHLAVHSLGPSNGPRDSMTGLPIDPLEGHLVVELFEKSSAAGYSFVDRVESNGGAPIALSGDTLLLGLAAGFWPGPNYVASYVIGNGLDTNWRGFPRPSGASSNFGASLDVSGDWAIVGDISGPTFFRRTDCGPLL